MSNTSFDLYKKAEDWFFSFKKSFHSKLLFNISLVLILSKLCI